jgi:hypothetical protein
LVRRAGQEDNEYSKARRELEQEAAPAGSVLNGSYAEESEAILPYEEQRPSRKAGIGTREAALAGSVLNGSNAEESEAVLPREEQLPGWKARIETLGLSDGLVYRKGMLWIPDNKDLIQKILESEHDTKVVGHMGQDKTIELICHNFWGPKMDERIIDYVRSYMQSQQNQVACCDPNLGLRILSSTDALGQQPRNSTARVPAACAAKPRAVWRIVVARRTAAAPAVPDWRSLEGEGKFDGVSHSGGMTHATLVAWRTCLDDSAE